MLNTITPYYIDVHSIGNSSNGYISIMEAQKDLPFEIKRVYWTYYTPQDIIRGFHAHKELYQIIFAVSGTINFLTENRNGEKLEFTLNTPNKGLYIPPLVWREIKFSHSAVLLCLASEYYVENDYIRDYQQFKKHILSVE